MRDQANSRRGLGAPSGLTPIEEIAYRLGRPSAAFEAPFNIAQYITLTASASDQQVAAFTLPQGNIGVLFWIGNGCNNPSDLTSVRWRIYLDDSPVPGYSGFLGSLGAMDYPWRIELPLPTPGVTVNVRVDNLTALEVSGVQARLSGVYWPLGSLPRVLAPMQSEWRQ